MHIATLIIIPHNLTDCNSFSKNFYVEFFHKYVIIEIEYFVVFDRKYRKGCIFMREKLLFLGMLVMSVLYCIEVIPGGKFVTLNYVGFGIALITIVPWLLSIFISLRKKSKAKAEKEAAKAAKKAEKEKD